MGSKGLTTDDIEALQALLAQNRKVGAKKRDENEG